MLAELSAAVRDGRVHPTELVTEALRRIEAHDGPIGSVVALRADEALDEAARRAARDRSRASRSREGPRRLRGPADDLRSQLYADAPPADGRRRAGRRGCEPPAHPDRQVEHARVRLDRLHVEPRVRHHAQPVESRAQPGRFERRVGRGARRRAGADRDRVRRRWFGSHPGVALPGSSATSRLSAASVATVRRAGWTSRPSGIIGHTVTDVVTEAASASDRLTATFSRCPPDAIALKPAGRAARCCADPCAARSTR